MGRIFGLELTLRRFGKSLPGKESFSGAILSGAAFDISPTERSLGGGPGSTAFLGQSRGQVISIDIFPEDGNFFPCANHG